MDCDRGSNSKKESCCFPSRLPFPSLYLRLPLNLFPPNNPPSAVWRRKRRRRPPHPIKPQLSQRPKRHVMHRSVSPQSLLRDTDSMYGPVRWYRIYVRILFFYPWHYLSSLCSAVRLIALSPTHATFGANFIPRYVDPVRGCASRIPMYSLSACHRR